MKHFIQHSRTTPVRVKVFAHENIEEHGAPQVIEFEEIQISGSSANFYRAPGDVEHKHKYINQFNPTNLTNLKNLTKLTILTNFTKVIVLAVGNQFRLSSAEQATTANCRRMVCFFRFSAGRGAVEW